MAVFWVEWHLPESGREVDCGEDAGAGSSNVSDAFGDVLHGVLVDLGFAVECPKILHDAETLSGLFRDTEDGRVV